MYPYVYIYNGQKIERRKSLVKAGRPQVTIAATSYTRGHKLHFYFWTSISIQNICLD